MSAFHVVAWANASDDERQKVSKVLGEICAKLASKEAALNQEPSAEYGAFCAAYGLLHHLKVQGNVESLPQDFIESMKHYRKP